MSKQEVSIIEMPFNLGLRQKFPGHQPGVNKLPSWLRSHHFHSLINADQTLRIDAPEYRIVEHPDRKVLNADAIIDYAASQEKVLHRVLSEKKFPLVLGGDCSIVVGITYALKKIGKYALLYLDGHTDFIEPELSETKAVGGMAAAISAGRGISALTNMDMRFPYIREENVWCVGNREYDDEYEDAIRLTDATYISLDMLRQTSIAATINSFINMVEKEKLDGFWVHIDIDVLADEIMPAVDSRTPGGLTYDELNQTLELLLISSKITGMDMTILDPDLDPAGIYTKEFVKQFTSTFNKARGEN